MEHKDLDIMDQFPLIKNCTATDMVVTVKDALNHVRMLCGLLTAASVVKVKRKHPLSVTDESVLPQFETLQIQLFIKNLMKAT